MKIGILGSGVVGQTIGEALAKRGHDVVVGTRDPGKLAEWQAKVGKQACASSFADAAAHGEIVINATKGDASLDALRQAGADNLKGKILIDISNPLDFSRGMPPTLFVSNDDSLGERIQAAFPESKVVKTLNTVTASVMVNPMAVAGGQHTLFLSGNDAPAKERVTGLLKEWFGWQDIIDLGDIKSARNQEMLLPLWVNLMMKQGNPMFQFKIVR